MRGARLEVSSKLGPHYRRQHFRGLLAALTGAFVNPDPVYLQSTGFVLDPAGEAVSSEIFDSPGAAGLTPAVRGGRAFVEPLLARAGLPAGLADALDDTGRDDEIRLEGDEALTLTGRDVGTPIIQFGPPEGTAFFGPVISRLPAPEDAVRLWDHVIGLAGFPGFAELKRSLRERPQLRSFGVDPDAAGAEEDWQAGRRKPAALDAPGRRRGLPSFRPAPPGSGDAGAGGSRRAGVKSEHTEQPGPPR